MTSTRDRDRTVEQLLRQRTPDGAGVPADGCFDADLVAAWMDGALTREELSAAEVHAAGCARCQQLLAAYARTEPATAPVERWPFRSALRWLVPLTAAAAAVAVWIAVRPIPSVAPASDARLDSAARLESAVRPEPPAQAVPPAPPSAPVADAQRSAGASEELSKVTRDAKLPPPRSAPADLERRERAAKVDAPVQPERADAAKSAGATPPSETPAAGRPSVLPPAASPAPAPQAAGAANARALTDRTTFKESAADSLAAAVLEIHSSDTTIVWRVRPDGAVERSADTGRTWETQYTGPAARITAGSSPAPTVCWLVGRSGSILLSTDAGRTWRRVSFVETADLVEVQARDGNRATVVTSDRRKFTTADGGRTWTPSPLQESPAAPF